MVQWWCCNLILFEGKVAVLGQILVNHPKLFKILKTSTQLHPKRFFVRFNGDYAVFLCFYYFYIYFPLPLLLVILFSPFVRLLFCVVAVYQEIDGKYERMEEIYISKFEPIQKHCNRNLNISLANKIEL